MLTCFQLYIWWSGRYSCWRKQADLTWSWLVCCNVPLDPSYLGVTAPTALCMYVHAQNHHWKRCCRPAWSWWEDGITPKAQEGAFSIFYDHVALGLAVRTSFVLPQYDLWITVKGCNIMRPTRLWFYDFGKHASLQKEILFFLFLCLVYPPWWESIIFFRKRENEVQRLSKARISPSFCSIISTP